MDPNFRPRTVDAIEINEVADGYVIYDPNQDRVHYLNHTAGVILELCNGRVSAGELPALVQAAYDLLDPPVNEVAGCVEKLIEERLIH